MLTRIISFTSDCVSVVSHRNILHIRDAHMRRWNQNNNTRACRGFPTEYFRISLSLSLSLRPYPALPTKPLVLSESTNSPFLCARS